MTTHIPLERVLAVKVEGEWIDLTDAEAPDIATAVIDLPGSTNRQPRLEGPAAGGPYLQFVGINGDTFAVPVSKISVWRFR